MTEAICQCGDHVNQDGSDDFAFLMGLWYCPICLMDRDGNVRREAFAEAKRFKEICVSDDYEMIVMRRKLVRRRLLVERLLNIVRYFRGEQFKMKIRAHEIRVHNSSVHDVRNFT